MPRRFRKKPVEVEAVRLTEDNIGEVADWCKGVERPISVALDLLTLHGWTTATPGDYIVKSPLGDFYPCVRDVFEACHEEVAASDNPGALLGFESPIDQGKP